MKRCALCNEYIEDTEFQFEEAIEVDGEYWHKECYEEYFGEAPEITTSTLNTNTYSSTRINQGFQRKS